MLIIQDKLISDDVIEENFVCHLEKCKGACCWEGDFGAVLEKEEIELLEKELEVIKPFLSKEGMETIKSKGVAEYFEELNAHGTPLQEDGACAYLVYEKGGMAKCGIEKAFEEGVTDFPKPISCHLYPIRIKEEKESGFVAVNYDQWSICKSACLLGIENQVPVYKFLKNAIIRKFGESFYMELEAAAKYYREKRESF